MEVRIGRHKVGNGHPCYVVAEIGINHNGSLDQAILLIEAAAEAGAQAVKFQKRTVDLVYSPEELARPRESVFGDTNGDLKRGLEFGVQEYAKIHECCEFYALDWFASPWDVPSVDFLEQFDVPCHKLASASITDHELVAYVASTGKPIILSTGMSTLDEVDSAAGIVEYDNGKLILMHCVSTYPSENRHINLRCMQTLSDRYRCPVGYSGHELGIATSVAAVALGACIVERHITLDRSLWGSDQAASLEPHAFRRMVRDIRAIEEAMGDGVKRLLDEERPIAAKLRRNG